MSSANRMVRIHAPFVSEGEIEKINNHLRSQEEPDYIDEILSFKNEKEIGKWLKYAEEAGEFAIDTETNSLDPHQAQLVGISISNEIGKACYIPLNHLNGNNLEEKKVSVFGPNKFCKAFKSTSPSLVVGISLTLNPHITAEAGLVPCAASGTRISSRSASPRSM